jgi:hypothetical protein
MLRDNDTTRPLDARRPSRSLLVASASRRAGTSTQGQPFSRLKG